jgi:hypothetical protein
LRSALTPAGLVVDRGRVDIGVRIGDARAP